MPNFQSKRVQVEAIQYLYVLFGGIDNTSEVDAFLGGREWHTTAPPSCTIQTPKGPRSLRPNDWVVNFADGSFDVLSEEEFFARYEPVSEEGEVRLRKEVLAVIGELVDIPAAGEGVQSRTVPGWPGYAVTSDGRVWSNRKIRRHAPESGNAWRPLKLSMTNKRLYAELYCGSTHGSKRLLVHRLVLLSFVGPPPSGMTGRRRNDNKEDNRLENLFWGPPMVSGRDYPWSGGCGNAILTAELARQIRDDYKLLKRPGKNLRNGELTKLREKYGISKGLLVSALYYWARKEPAIA